MNDKRLAEILRVNQAGEYGAKRIYEGQIAALGSNSDITQLVHHMYVQELEHLAYFDNALQQNRSRPTCMSPIWHTAGYLLGFVSGKLGAKAAMACTAAVENVIDQHYQEQINYLEEQQLEKKELIETIKKFREEELEHRDIGLEHTSLQPHYQLFQIAIGTLTKIAINISKKF